MFSITKSGRGLNQGVQLGNEGDIEADEHGGTSATFSNSRHCNGGEFYGMDSRLRGCRCRVKRCRLERREPSAGSKARRQMP